MRALIFSWNPPWVKHVEEMASACGLRIEAVVVPASNKERMKRISEAVPGLTMEPADDLKAVAGIVRKFKPEVGVCVGFPWRIGADIIAAHARGIVNGHPALLPDGRGPFPIAWAIREERREVGFTFHRMSEAYDQGPVLAQEAFLMPADTSLASLQPLMMALSRRLMPKAFARVHAGELGEPQAETRATWAGPFEDDYLRIDWGRTAKEIDRQVRAWQWMGVNGIPRGPVTEVNGRRVRVVRASTTEPAGQGVVRMQASDGPVYINTAPLEPAADACE